MEKERERAEEEREIAEKRSQIEGESLKKRLVMLEEFNKSLEKK